MKKKLLAVVLAGVMSMSMLTACGGTETTAEVEKAAVEEETEAEETTEDASGDMCSGFIKSGSRCYQPDG